MQERTVLSIALAIAFLSCPWVSMKGQTKVALNTGYDNAALAPYTTVTASTSTTIDNYWINLMSYPPVTAPAPSWVLQHPGAPWNAALPSTHWISGRPTAGSPGTQNDPGYTLFRKCFCLLQEYTQPALSFKVRADDTVQVWFNTQLNVVLPPSPGQYNGPALTSVPSKTTWFRPGPNCLYVLVENYGGYMGFDMEGVIQAYGLMPGAAAGADQQFECPCRTRVNRSASFAQAPSSDAAGDDEVIKALTRIAERRRLERMKQRQQR